MENKRPQIGKAILRKKNGVEGISLPASDQITKLIIQTVGYWKKNKYRSMKQDRKPKNKPMYTW